MAVLLALAAWSTIAMLAGLITGTPAARTFGAIGVVVFFGFAFLLDQYYGFRERQQAWRTYRSDVRRVDDFDAINFDWRKERKGA